MHCVQTRAFVDWQQTVSKTRDMVENPNISRDGSRLGFIGVGIPELITLVYPCGVVRPI